MTDTEKAAPPAAGVAAGEDGTNIKAQQNPIDTVADFLVEGHAAVHIVEYLESQTMTADAAMNVLHEALNKFVKVAKLPKEVRRGWLIECARDLYRQMKHTGDYTGALKALQEISKLSATYPSKSAPLPTVEETSDEIDDYIKEMMDL